MGKPRTFGKPDSSRVLPPPIYRDDPVRDDTESVSALSLHSNIGESSNAPLYDDDDDEDDTQEDLPPYSDEATTEASPRLQRSVQPVALDVTDIEQFEHSDKKGSRKFILSNTFTSDPVLLEKAIRNQLFDPPRTYISISGEHTEKRYDAQKKKTESHTVTDFDVRIDISELHRTPPLHHAPGGTLRSPAPGNEAWSRLITVSNNSKTYRGGVIKRVNKSASQQPSDVENGVSLKEHVPNLTEWVHRFCASHYSLKSFEVRHEIAGRDDAVLQARVEEYVRATNYRGRLTVSFGTSPRTQTYQTRHRMNLARHNNWIWWICVILQLWIVTWPILFFTNKRWAVVKIIWPVHKSVPVDPQRPQEGLRRVYRSVSEYEWLQRWRYSIQQAVLNKCTAGYEIQYLGEGQEEARARAEREAETASRRASEPTNGFVGGVLSLARGISNVNREFNDARGWGYDE